MPPCERYTDWACTLFKCETKPPVFDDEVMTFLAFGDEKTKSGKQHWQIFVQLAQPHSKKEMQVACNFRKAHVEPTWGDSEQNLKYCSKDGRYETFGEFTIRGPKVEKKESCKKFFAYLEANVPIPTKYECFKNFPSTMACRPRLYDTM